MHAQPNTTAGLINSLQSLLPHNSPLARRARRTADRLGHGRTADAERAAADLLADLLTAADADLSGYHEDGIVDAEWDAL